MQQLPTSRVPDPRAAPPLRWGVIGTGWIAERFVAAAQKLTQQQISAVGSRTQTNADEFARRFDLPKAYDSYEELVRDPDLDVIYVATPHNLHLAHARLALEQGLHVLVEKPLALNVSQGQDIVDLAAERGLFCLEALWSLYLPKFDVIAQLLADGSLGKIHTVIADNDEWFTDDHRIQRRELGGGPMLDLGTYPISLAQWVLGRPRRVAAIGAPAPSGVNGQVGMLLEFEHGAQAVLHTSILGSSPVNAVIVGSEATLTIDGVFYRPGGFTVTAQDGSWSHRYDESAPYDDPERAYDGLCFEAAEVARRVSAGETGSAVRTPADSLMLLTTMDEVRRQIGASFPEED